MIDAGMSLPKVAKTLSIPKGMIWRMCYDLQVGTEFATSPAQRCDMPADGHGIVIAVKPDRLITSTDRANFAATALCRGLPRPTA